jgi:hypothetical protein
VLALDLDVVETVFEGETHDLGTLGLGRPVGDQRQLDAQLLQPVEGLVCIGEQRQFLVVQGAIGVGQCVTDCLGRPRMAGRRQGGKGGRDDAAARVTGSLGGGEISRLAPHRGSRGIRCPERLVPRHRA